MARILTLTSWYPPHHFGGYELSCFDVMTRWVTRGHEVRVLCGDERVPGARPPDAGHEALVRRSLRPHFHEATRTKPRLRELVAIERAGHRVLAEQLAEFRPDVVSVWHMVAIPTSLLQLLTESGVPVVYVVCDNWPVYTASTDPWIARFEGGPLRALAGRAVQRATGMPTTRGRFTDRGTFCFVSETTRRSVTDAKPWSYPVSTVVYSGIEPADFPAPDSSRDDACWSRSLRSPLLTPQTPARAGREATRPSSRSPRLLYVGRLDAWKGVDTLLRALARLPTDVTLECFGRGADHERARLRELATTLGVGGRVEFGSLERDELASRYRAADVVVFPSEWPEPFGLVPLEAMACGTPVVASGVGGSGEFLRDGENCVRFRARDERSLAGAITRLLEDADLRRIVVKGGYETARELDVDRLADTLEEWHVAAFSGCGARDRARDLAAAGVIRVPPREPTDDRAEVVAALLARGHGPVLELTAEARTVRAAGAIVRADAHALPFRDHGFDAATAPASLASCELARVILAGASVIFTETNPHDALVQPRRLLERLRLGPAPDRRTAPPFDRNFEVVARHATAWTGGRKRALASRFVRLGPLRRFGPATVVETRTRRARVSP